MLFLYAAAGLVLVMFVWAFLRWLRRRLRASQSILTNVWFWLAFLLVCLGIVLLLRGQLWAAFSSLLALPALFVRWLPLWDAVRLFGGHGFGYRYAGTKRKDDTTITVDEARDILGLRDVSPLTEEVINKAYKNLMRKVHPDHGGSSGLAARLNTAREVLLRRYS